VVVAAPANLIVAGQFTLTETKTDRPAQAY
jgi:hypothetical protein